MREFRGLIALAGLTLRRQALGRKSLVAAILIVLLCLATVVWSQRRALKQGPEFLESPAAVVRFSRDIVLSIYAGILLPILSLVYATAAFGDEREERTLVYLLVRPLSRYRLYVAKGLGILPLVLVTGLVGFGLVCWCAGPPGKQAWGMYWPAIARGCLAYTALFLLFGALVPRPVAVAVVYAFLVEAMVGNMPGTIKRVSVSFFVKCLVYDTGSGVGLVVPKELQFLPVTGPAAAWVLDLSAVLLLALGAVLFHRKEYREFG